MSLASRRCVYASTARYSNGGRSLTMGSKLSRLCGQLSLSPFANVAPQCQVLTTGDHLWLVGTGSRVNRYTDGIEQTYGEANID
jgi:hypothetical protein